MFHQSSFICLAVLAVSLVQLSAAKAVDGQEARSAYTVTSVVTSYYTTPTTTTILKSEVCAVLASTNMTACRRKRDYWIDLPILIAPNVDHDLLQQFQPSPILKVEPTPVAQFRDGLNPAAAVAVDSTLDENTDMYMRSANPLVLNLLPQRPISTAISIISSLLTPDVTVVSTLSSYTSTVSTTIFTAKSNYTLASCIPSGLTNFLIC